jgi:hypothetical protein
MEVYNLQMNKKYAPLAILVAIIVVGLIAWAFANKMGLSGGVSQPTGDSLVYSNAAYGFEISYPKDLFTETSFRKYYALSDKWRSQAPDEQLGIAVVAIPVFRVNNEDGIATGKPYPLYFSAEVRVGVSSNAQAVADCLKTDPGYVEQKHETVTLNGAQFERFEFADAAMMQYSQGVSYRAVHNNMCFAIEQLKAGSNYRDETMGSGISDAALDVYYAQAGEIAKTFKFTK